MESRLKSSFADTVAPVEAVMEGRGGGSARQAHAAFFSSVTRTDEPLGHLFPWFQGIGTGFAGSGATEESGPEIYHSAQPSDLHSYNAWASLSSLLLGHIIKKCFF